MHQRIILNNITSLFMISFETKNLQNISKKHGLTQEEIQAQASRITPFIKKIHTRDQGFYKVIDDTEVLSKINAYAASIEGKYQDLVILGIGGYHEKLVKHPLTDNGLKKFLADWEKIKDLQN